MVQGELSWGRLLWAEEAPEMQEVVGEAGLTEQGGVRECAKDKTFRK